MLTTTPLAAWTLTAASTVPVALPDGGLAVTVPGCVHTDLMAAGLIPDPYLDLNETLTAWVSQADWTYSTTLPAIVAPHADVVFEGLDTVADLYLDDRLLGSVTDMHRTWRFPLGPGPAGRILQVRFRSKARAAAAAALAKGLASGYPQPFNAIRSMACSFGWDWGPMTITSGIWRPARVETWSTARLDEVRAAVSLVGGDGVLDIVAAAVGDLTGLDVVASCDGVTVTAAPGPLQLVVPRPAVWWPVGFGEQPLSDVTVELRRGDVVLDQRALRVGFRTVQWHRDPDAEGTPLVCRVNGVRVNQRGFSWIPDDLRVLVIRRYLPDWLAAVSSAMDDAKGPKQQIVTWVEANLKQAADTGHGWLMGIVQTMPSNPSIDDTIDQAHTVMRDSINQAWSDLLDADESKTRIAAALTAGILNAGFRELAAGQCVDLVIEMAVTATKGLVRSLARQR